MQVVIEIPDDKYYLLCMLVESGNGTWVDRLVVNGAQLPKGHGRLIDVDKIIGKIHGVRSITAVLDAPIIIPADEEDTE